METIISILTILCGIAIALIPIYFRVSRVIKRKKKLTPAGYIVVGISLLFIAFQAFQIVLAERQIVSAKNELRLNDSLNKAFIKENNKSIVTPFAEGLRKYGLKYDSARREIAILVRDSSKKVIITNSIVPELDICNIEMKQNVDTMKSELTICSSQSTAYKLRVKVFYLSRNKEDILTFQNIPDDSPIDKMLPETSYTHFRTFYGDFKDITKLYFLIKITYNDFNGRNYYFETLRNYDRDKKVYGLLTLKEKIWVADFFNKSGITNQL